MHFNAGQKYCRMLQGEHSAILMIFINLPFSIKIFVLSISKWSLKTGFTVSKVVILSVKLFFILVTNIFYDCLRSIIKTHCVSM